MEKKTGQAKALADLRRFLKARWEEGDPALFMIKDRTPVAGKAGHTPASLAPTAGGRPSAQPPVAPPSRPSMPSRPALSPRPASPTAKADRHPSGVLARPGSVKGSALIALYEKIKGCADCGLARTRTNFVFGCGNPDAAIFFVGEAPGEQEDKQGLAFVGPAGQLLNRLLEAAGIARDDVFIANVLKCRPPGNRKPDDDEIEACEQHLTAQVRIMAPRFLVALGTFAAQSLLRTAKPIGQIRGRWYKIGDSDFLATYHPSAGLRAGDFKRVIEADMKLLKEKLDKTRANPAG
jgi:DNA polymerase